MSDTSKQIINDRESPISLSDFRALMFKKVIPLKSLTDFKGEPIGKVVAFWRRNGLLPFVEDGSWIKLSCVQLIWLRVLDDLRKINFPVGKMKTICDYFFKDAYNDDLPKINLEFNKSEIEKKILAGTETDEDRDWLDYINLTLNNPLLLKVLKTDINYLSNFIAYIIAEGEDGGIFIFFDGSVFEFLGKKYIGHKDPPDMSKPYIRLSITNYLSEFIAHEELSEIMMNQLLNEDELKVLKEMRRKNVLKITINRSGNKKLIVESTTGGVITDNNAREIMQILGLKNYSDITLKTIDEKSLSFAMTRKNI